MEQIETSSFIQTLDVPAEPDGIRIVCWNINRGLQLDGIVEFLRREAADLVLLQEADVNARRTQYRNVAREIARALRMHYAFGCEFQELTQGNHSSPAYHGQATLSRLPFLESRILRFRRQSGFWRPRWFVPNLQSLQRRIGARMALVSHLLWLEKPLIVYNVHLESRGADALRCCQLTEILEDLHQYSPDVPIVIAGDFNFDLSQRPGASLISRRAFDNPFSMGKARPTTVPSRLGRGRIVDWILLRGPFEYGDPQLHDSERSSDHYPLSLVLKPNSLMGSAELFGIPY